MHGKGEENVYRIGDYVMKASTGLCRIADILHPEGMGIDSDKIFYRMVPLEDEKANIYVPVDNESLPIRKAMSEEEAWKLIREIPQTEAVQIENEKQREQEYKKAIASGSPRALVSIIKTMYLRKQKRFAQGKKSTAMDERYFKMAEDYLYSELAFAIGKNKSEMQQLIADTIKGCEKCLDF